MNKIGKQKANCNHAVRFLFRIRGTAGGCMLRILMISFVFY